MAELIAKVVGFLMILMLPFVVVGGALVSLFAVGALFDALDNPQDLRGRIEAAFRRPPRAPRMTRADHYYRPFWAGRS
jgi:hypothetical protein